MSTSLRSALTVLAVLTLVGCPSPQKKTPPPAGGSTASVPTRPPHPTPSAPVNVVAMAGPTLGTIELRTNACHSGEQYVFRGADVFDKTTKEVLALRLVLDPIEGPMVRIFKDSEWGPSIILKRKDCSTFDYTLEGTGNSVNFINEVRVALQLDCRSQAGDFVVGKVDLPACL